MRSSLFHRRPPLRTTPKNRLALKTLGASGASKISPLWGKTRRGDGGGDRRRRDGVLLFAGMIIVHRSPCRVSVPRFLIEVNMKSVMRLIHQNLRLPLQKKRKEKKEGQRRKKKSLLSFKISAFVRVRPETCGQNKQQQQQRG